MFRKILMVLGGLFLLAVLLFAGVFLWARQTGSQRQDQFFAAVSSGDPEQVIAMFHPSLREQVDPPVLAAWMSAVQDKLGAYQGLSKTDFSTSAKATGEGVRVESKGTANFEKGTARSDLTFLGGQLTEFSVQSDALKDWFHGPAATDLYRERGKEFLTNLLRDEPQAAFAMMHPELQKIMPVAKLQEMATRNAPAGKLESVDYRSEDEVDGQQELKVFYRMKTDKGEQVSSVDFKFVGLKGHLVGFNLKDHEGVAARRDASAVR